MILLLQCTIHLKKNDPFGLTCKLYAVMNKKMRPSDEYAIMDMQEEVRKLDPKRSQDPDNLNNAIEEIKGK